jgi:hypothetical protein
VKTIKQEYSPEIDVSALTEHPDNPRKGDTTAVGDSIKNNGFYGAIIVQKSTNRVLAGHTRLRAAISQGASTVPGFFVDVDETQAKKILLADNRTADLAYYDDETLYKTLASIMDNEGTLKGTAYDDSTFKLLMSRNTTETLLTSPFESMTGTNSDNADSNTGNVDVAKTPADRLESYESGNIRTIILPFSSNEYGEIVEQFASLRDVLGVKTNAEVVKVLLTEATEGL